MMELPANVYHHPLHVCNFFISEYVVSDISYKTRGYTHRSDTDEYDVYIGIME